MSVDVLTPFLNGAQEMLTMMLGIESQTEQESDPDPQILYVSGIISLSGTSEGQVAVCFGKDCAIQAVSLMMGMGPDEIDNELLGDMIGEMANIIVGAAKRGLSETEYDFSLSTPSIIIGNDHRLQKFKSTEQKQGIVHTELGDFYIRVWLCTNL